MLSLSKYDILNGQFIISGQFDIRQLLDTIEVELEIGV